MSEFVIDAEVHSSETSPNHVLTNGSNVEFLDSSLLQPGQGVRTSSPIEDEAPPPTAADGGARPKRGTRRTPRLRTVSTMSCLTGQCSKQKKIYSVSFQDNGFSFRETSVLDANERWGLTFHGNEHNFSELDSSKLDEEIQKYTSTSPSVAIPTMPCNYSFGEPDRILLSKSLDAGKQTSYQAFGGTTPPSARPSPVVFCIHGNKFGVAHCCDDLWPKHDDTDNSTVIDDKQALIPSDEEKKKKKKHRSSDGELHCHTADASSITNTVDKRARRKLIIASVLCLLFMVVEIVGGVLANSLAIATDAAHLLTDFASFMISLFSLWVASRPATRSMSFGWHRAEVIGATVSVLMIWVVTGVLVYAAIQRVSTMQFELDPTIMLITSGIGVLVNIIMGCSLHQHGHTHGGGSSHSHKSGDSAQGGHEHSHDHGHSHGDNLSEVEAQAKAAADKKRENINVRAAFIHVIGDFIQSLGVFIAALIIYFYPAYIIIDPICTFIFSILVLITTIRILRDTMIVLMEGIPKDISFTIVQDTFLSVEGIVAVHNLRIWGLTTDKTALAAHLAIAPGANFQQILQEASMRIRAKYDFYEMTLQVEEFHEDMDDCTQCQAPEQ